MNQYQDWIRVPVVESLNDDHLQMQNICELNGGQFNKEIQVYFTSRTLVSTNSHQFESTESLCKFPLEASNLYLMQKLQV